MEALTRVPLELLLHKRKLMLTGLRVWCWLDHRCRLADAPHAFYWRDLAADLGISQNPLYYKVVPTLAELGWISFHRPDVPARTTVRVQVDTRVAHDRAMAATRIPLALLDAEFSYAEDALTFSAFKAWCWINHHNRVRDAPLTTSQLMLYRQLGMAETTSRPAIRQLEAAGWLRVEKLRWNYGFVLDTRPDM